MLRNKKYISLFFIFLLFTNLAKADQLVIGAKYYSQISDKNYEIGNNTISHHAFASRALENQRFSRYQSPSKDRNWYNLKNDNSWKNLTLPYFAKYEQLNNNRPNFDEYDFQTTYKNFNTDKFAKYRLGIDNSSDQQFSVKKEWFGQTQAFDKSAGESFTLPYIQEDNNVAGVRTNRDLIGDLILTTPIEYKINRGDFTSGVSLTPSILLPNGNSSADEGNINFGVSVAY